MKLNKPKHNLFRNGGYAVEGFVDIVKNETSFKWQLLMFAVLGTIAWILPISFGYASILFLSLFIPILSDYHILAKQAKDAGATLVLLSLIVMVLIWSAVLLMAFKIV